MIIHWAIGMRDCFCTASGTWGHPAPGHQWWNSHDSATPPTCEYEYNIRIYIGAIARQRVNTANTKALKLVWWHCDTSLTAIHALSSKGFANWASARRFWEAPSDKLTWQGTYHVFQFECPVKKQIPVYPLVGSIKPKESQQNQNMSGQIRHWPSQLPS